MRILLVLFTLLCFNCSKKVDTLDIPVVPEVEIAVDVPVDVTPPADVTPVVVPADVSGGDL